jgi:hypothetical protein
VPVISLTPVPAMFSQSTALRAAPSLLVRRVQHVAYSTLRKSMTNRTLNQRDRNVSAIAVFDPFSFHCHKLK